MIEQLKALDYNKGLGQLLQSINTAVIHQMVDDILNSKPKPAKSLIYFALRVRAASEGYPNESRPIGSLEDVPVFADIILPNAAGLFFMEEMRRDGLISISKYPESLESKTDTVEYSPTDNGVAYLNSNA